MPKIITSFCTLNFKNLHLKYHHQSSYQSPLNFIKTYMNLKKNISMGRTYIDGHAIKQRGSYYPHFIKEWSEIIVCTSEIYYNPDFLDSKVGSITAHWYWAADISKLEHIYIPWCNIAYLSPQTKLRRKSLRKTNHALC